MAKRDIADMAYRVAGQRAADAAQESDTEQAPEPTLRGEPWTRPLRVLAAGPPRGGRSAEPMTICPFCGGRIARTWEVTSAGEREYSECCEVSLDLLDNYDVYAALPPALQQIAIGSDRKELRAYKKRIRQNIEASIRDRPARLEFDRRNAHLLKSYGADRNVESGLYERRKGKNASQRST